MRTVAIILAILAAVLPGSAAGADPLTMRKDSSEKIVLEDEGATVVLSDPSVADVLPIRGNLLVVTARALGRTGLLVLDRNGRTLYDGRIVVLPDPTAAVTVNRGVETQRLMCAPVCVPEEVGSAPARTAPAQSGAGAP